MTAGEIKANFMQSLLRDSPFHASFSTTMWNRTIAPQDRPQHRPVDVEYAMRKLGKVTSRSDRLIAEQVKQHSHNLGWDQKELARRLDRSEGYISRMLSGERPWPVALLFHVSRLFKVPVSDLDPDLEAALKKDLGNLELRRDIPQLRVLHTFVKHLPRITDPADLQALVRVIFAFSDRHGSR